MNLLLRRTIVSRGNVFCAAERAAKRGEVIVVEQDLGAVRRTLLGYRKQTGGNTRAMLLTR